MLSFRSSRVLIKLASTSCRLCLMTMMPSQWWRSYLTAQIRYLASISFASSDTLFADLKRLSKLQFWRTFMTKSLSLWPIPTVRWAHVRSLNQELLFSNSWSFLSSRCLEELQWAGRSLTTTWTFYLLTVCKVPQILRMKLQMVNRSGAVILWVTKLVWLTTLEETCWPTLVTSFCRIIAHFTELRSTASRWEITTCSQTLRKVCFWLLFWCQRQRFRNSIHWPRMPSQSPEARRFCKPWSKLRRASLVIQLSTSVKWWTWCASTTSTTPRRSLSLLWEISLWRIRLMRSRRA